MADPITRSRASWLDRTIRVVAPQWHLRRLRARLAADFVARHYEAAAVGRRTDQWHRTSGDANSATHGVLSRVRDHARDLVRNNPYARSALETIADHTVGWGIRAAAPHARWTAWADSTACDADGQRDLAGLETLVIKTVAQSGEALVRRRFRRVEDDLPLPLQLQVLEPDYLDSLKTQELPSGGRIIQGIELDAVGRRVAYWLFRDHPGASVSSTSRIFGPSRRIPADQIAHVYLADRPGQMRGVSWFAPVILRFKDFDEFEDATLMKQKIAACLSVITTDPDGSAPALGTTTTDEPTIDTLEPGMILNVAPGRSVDVVSPPSVREYKDFVATSLRGIATALGVSYEDLTGDYTATNFSAARMSRLRHWARVESWRWRLLIPQLLDPVWSWAMAAAALVGAPVVATTEWTAPPLPMIEPDKEGLAIMRNVRAGISTLSEEIRARGYNVAQFLDELQHDFAELDRRGLVLDSDPRKMTQNGQAQTVASETPAERQMRLGVSR